MSKIIPPQDINCLFVKAYSAVGGIGCLLIGVSDVRRVHTQPSVAVYPLAWTFLFVWPILTVLFWRMFLMHRWAGLAICILSWILIRDFVTAPGGINRSGVALWLLVAVTIHVTSVLSMKWKDWSPGI